MARIELRSVFIIPPKSRFRETSQIPWPNVKQRSWNSTHTLKETRSDKSYAECIHVRVMRKNIWKEIFFKRLQKMVQAKKSFWPQSREQLLSSHLRGTQGYIVPGTVRRGGLGQWRWIKTLGLIWNKHFVSMFLPVTALCPDSPPLSRSISVWR